MIITTGIILNLTPGLDTMYILNRSISQGKKSGILSVFGISSGSFVHIFTTSCGLSIVLANADAAFNVVKYVGSAYLIYLGVKTIIDTYKKNFLVLQLEGETVLNYHSVYIQGLLTNLLNPKVALFFLVLLPQFVSSNPKHMFLSFLSLGGIFIITGTIWCLCLAIFASFITKKMRDDVRISLILSRVSGCIFIILGLLIFK